MTPTLDEFTEDSSSGDQSESANRDKQVGSTVGRRASTTDILENSDLPEWGPIASERGLKTRQFVRDTHLKPGDLSRFSIRWVVGGDIESYCRKHGTERVPIPNSYSAFDEWDGYIHRADATSGKFGFGIGPKRLEQALRVLTGGGRYSAQQYFLLACGPHPAVLTGNEGTVLISLGPVERLDTSQVTPHDIQVETAEGTQEFSVYESNSAVHTGIKRFLKAQAANNDAEYDSIKNKGDGDYYFSFEDSTKRDSISGEDLAHLGNVTPQSEDIPAHGGGEVTAPDGSKHEVTWSPTHTTDDHIDGNPVIGYELVWKQPKHLSEWTCAVDVVYLCENYSGFDSRNISERLVTITREGS